MERQQLDNNISTILRQTRIFGHSLKSSVGYLVKVAGCHFFSKICEQSGPLCLWQCFVLESRLSDDLLDQRKLNSLAPLYDLCGISAFIYQSISIAWHLDVDLSAQ